MSELTVTEKPMWLRILQFPLTRIILLGPIIFLMMMTNNGYMEAFKSNPPVAIAITIGLALVTIAAYVLWGKYIERREVTELSTPGMGREWASGALIGFGLIASCVLILIALGMYRIEGLNAWSMLLPAVAMAISSGIFEELFFRGVLFKSVEDMAGSWIAVAVSSLIFGFTHLLNPAGTIVGAIYISVEAGLLLAAAYLITRRLWIGIGVHMAWNYTLSAIFSGIVSGGDTDPGLIKSIIEGPELLTGGNFGIESSIFALILCTTVGVVLMAIAVRRGHVLPPPWKR